MLQDKWVELLLRVDFTRQCYSSGKLKILSGLSGPTVSKVTRFLVEKSILRKERIGFSFTPKGEMIRSKLLELERMMEAK